MVLIIDFAQYMQEKKNCISYHGKHKCNYKMTTWLTFVQSLLHSYQFDVYNEYLIRQHAIIMGSFKN